MNKNAKLGSLAKTTSASVLQHMLGYLTNEQWIDAKLQKMSGNNTFLLAYLEEKHWQDAKKVLPKQALPYLLKYATDVDKKYLLNFKKIFAPIDFSKSEMTIEIDGTPKPVLVSDYVTAKTKDLIGFGYTSLKESDVLQSVNRILNKEKLVDVIDHFIEDDIVLK